MKVTLLTLIVALSAFSISLSASADPECVYRQIRELPMHWSNPSDCGRFYRCTNKNVKREVVCAADKEYNPKTGKCASAGKGYCKLSLIAPVVGDDNACSDEVSGAAVPQPGSCRNFYLCDNNNAYPQVCDAGSIFDTAQGACIPDTKAECWQNYCLEQADGTYLADDTSCLNFFICTNKDAVQQSCDAGSYFNATALNCEPDADGSNCQDNICINQNDGESVPNPVDCYSYYICNGGKATLQECGDDSHFDQQLKACIPGACPTEPTTPCEPTPAPPCTGECTCPGGYTEGTFLPDPTSCMHYYICTGGVLVRNECTNGLFYNKANEVCELDTENACPQCNANYRRARRSLDVESIQDNKQNIEEEAKGLVDVVDVEDNLDIMPVAALQAIEKTDAIEVESHHEVLLKEDLSAPKLLCAGLYLEGQLISHESECRKYQLCHDGELSTHECGVGSYFDGEQGACLRDEFYVCNPRPEPEPQPEPEAAVETAVVPYVEGDGGCSCPGGYASGTLTTHPTDCDKYYVCENGQLIIQECGKNYKFDSTLNVCVPDVDNTCWPKDDGCGCSSTPPVNYCNGKPNGMNLPNPQDCSAYYTCNNNQATATQCNYDSWFDPTKNICTLDLNATCINPCKGSTGIKFLPHPDCSKFYFCNGGTTTVDSCPDTTGFNEQLGACTANAPCPSNKCFNAADGTTFADPDDTTKFFVCISHVAVQGTCQQNTQFNTNIGVCMSAPSDNCNQTACTASTMVPPYETINKSPNSFCYCRNDGAYEISCQNDYLFNAAIGVCYSNAPCDPEVCLEKPEYTYSVNRNNTNGFCLCVAEKQVEVSCPCGLEFNPRPMRCLPPITQDPNCNPTYCLNQPDLTTAPATTTNGGFCMCQYGGSTYHSCPINAIFNPMVGVCVPSTAEAQCDLTECAKSINVPFATYNDPYAFCYCVNNNTAELRNCPTGTKFSSASGVCLREFCSSFTCTASTPSNEPFPANDYPYGFCLCNGNDAVLHECPAYSIFDNNVGACVPEVNLECDLSACKVSGKPYPYDVPSVNDEYSFCYCINGDTVHLIHCPPGKIYDQQWGACVNETIVTPPPCGGTDECTCPGGYAAGSWLPHPTNCNQFYICQNGVLELQSCGVNNYYSPSVAACMPDTSGTCTDTPSTCTCVGAFKENELVANAQNRNSYYRCLNAQLREETCAPGYYFDGLQSACYSEENTRQFYKPRSAITEDVRSFKVLTNLFKKFTSVF